MKIDEKSQATREEASNKTLTIPKNKGSKELKNLEMGSNFYSYGSRTRFFLQLIRSHEDEYCIMEYEGTKHAEKEIVDQKYYE